MYATIIRLLPLSCVRLITMFRLLLVDELDFVSLYRLSSLPRVYLFPIDTNSLFFIQLSVKSTQISSDIVEQGDAIL